MKIKFDNALQISGGTASRAGSSSSSASSESTAASDTASKITESDLELLDSASSVSGRRLLKQTAKAQHSAAAVASAKPDPARVSGEPPIPVSPVAC